MQPGPALACFRPIRHAAVPKVVARAAHEDTDALLEDIGGTAIYLVGMMGSGKSTVGRLLAETLQGLDGQQPGVHRWVAPTG